MCKEISIFISIYTFYLNCIIIENDFQENIKLHSKNYNVF